MGNERYSVDLVVSTDDFANCGWKAVLEKASREGYSSMWQAFPSVARTVSGDNRPSHGKVLWLLADACFIKLSPRCPNEFFKLFMVMEGRRSVIPDDLSESYVAFYAEFVDEIDDAWLSTRVSRSTSLEDIVNRI